MCKMKSYQTIKVWRSTRKKMKVLAANIDISMTQLIDDLIEEKISSVAKEKEGEVN